MTNKTWYKYSERKPRLDFSRIRVRRGVVVADVGRAAGIPANPLAARQAAADLGG